MIYAISIVLLVLMMLLWITVQAAARRFAERHPEFGPAREMGHGCGACIDGGCAGKCEEDH
ncbi:uncharacterized protein NMK_0673 [Novimethylophilus kurashikiensis]|uniref:Uncharacterized protein n=1 Tax=Novimethylophilus kurashikiensis TaxID=1825523 RepID=A0A2R5F4I6_9PROT|nr:chemotaxis protein [Novimethylophilus kurashikiensis]GBG13135.1 uncharacterized protein NMK_0673 [Novimethylophilus kurashikiensis]